MLTRSNYVNMSAARCACVSGEWCLVETCLGALSSHGLTVRAYTYRVAAYSVRLYSVLIITQVLITARCRACAVYAMALCPSVCLSQVGVLLKRLNV